MPMADISTTDAGPRKAAIPAFSAPYAPPDEAFARGWLSQPPGPEAERASMRWRRA